MIGSKGPVIDGFRKTPQTITPALKKITRVSNSTPRPAGAMHQRAQRSKTLMRSIVSAPAEPKRQEAKVSAPKARTSTASPKRISRAMTVAKNASVKHFGNPINSAKPSLSVQAAKVKSTLSGEVISSKPTATSGAMALQAPPSMITSVSHHKLERMLDEALIKADAHKQALRDKMSPKRSFLHFGKGLLPGWMIAGVVTFAVLVVGGFFAWQKVPQLSTRIASLRAHVSASVPSYTPTGFSMSGPAVAKNNSVTMQYHANGDSSKYYTVKEEPSNQDTSSLMANHTSSNQQVQTAQANGVQIVMTGAKTMCVSGGKLTTVADNSGLSPDELLNIAKSVCS